MQSKSKLQFKIIVAVLILVLGLLGDCNSTTRRKARKVFRQEQQGSSSSRRRQEKSVKPTASNTLSNNEPEFDSLITNVYNEQIVNNLDAVSSLRKASNSDRTINVTAILGQSAFLPCAVRNIGAHNLLWLRVRDGDVLAFDDMLITQDARFKLIKKATNESNLLIQNVRLGDSGEYVCQINTENTKSKSVYLIILTPPSFSDAEQQSNHIHHNHPNHGHHQNGHDKLTKSINVIEGKQLALECHAFGYPKPTINWYVKRHESDNLTVFSLNTSKIYVANVMQKQYDYFECEASNKVPPSISRKFKINVQYRPEINLSPNRVYIASLPVKVRINCTVSSFPESTLNWIHNYINLKETNQQTLKKLRQALDFQNFNNSPAKAAVKRTRLNKLSKKNAHKESHLANNNNNNENAINEQPLLTSSLVKYNIIENVWNETHKQSVLIINVESENDFGAYECFASNNAGTKSAKFYIYGELSRPSLSSALNLTESRNIKRPSTSSEEIINFNNNYKHQQKVFNQENYISYQSSQLPTNGKNQTLSSDKDTVKNLLFDTLFDSSSSSNRNKSPPSLFSRFYSICLILLGILLSNTS